MPIGQELLAVKDPVTGVIFTNPNYVMCAHKMMTTVYLSIYIGLTCTFRASCYSARYDNS